MRTLSMVAEIFSSSLYAGIRTLTPQNKWGFNHSSSNFAAKNPSTIIIRKMAMAMALKREFPFQNQIFRAFVTQRLQKKVEYL